ncbi:MAG: hypothetical protein IJU95_10195 [Treponema sp.]|nr:hypothetical protein [Treponema sp.]
MTGYDKISTDKTKTRFCFIQDGWITAMIIPSYVILPGKKAVLRAPGL